MKKQYYIYEMNTNILNLLSLVLLVVVIFISFILDKNLLLESFRIHDYFFFLLAFIAYFCCHELLHSIGYVVHGADFKNVTYGMALEKGILYCLCKQNINKKNILISLMYPLFFIGILTYIIALIYKLPLLFFLLICNIGGAIGDIIMFMFIVKLDKDIEYSEFDSEMGFGIYTDKDLTKINHFGLKYLGTQDDLLRKDLKKIKISKPSIIILTVFLILGLICDFI